jgi:hypothetical protein
MNSYFLSFERILILCWLSTLHTFGYEKENVRKPRFPLSIIINIFAVVQ